MKTVLFLLLALLSACTVRTEKDPYGERVLLEEHDSRGRLVKKVVTECSPGEDVELILTRYDTLGRKVSEYGIEPYGHPFRRAYVYDTGKRPVEELIYTLTNLDIKNFDMRGTELYTLGDTLADITGVVDTRVTFTYDDVHNRLFKRSFERDTLNRFILSRVDTVEHE